MEVWFQVISELLINLSAGWFGAAIVLPITGKIPKKLYLQYYSGLELYHEKQI
jgi:hypothetical protein